MLFQLVDRLPADQRLVIMRRFVEQKSVREIAQELGRSEGAVKQLQFRALETLRGQVRKHHE
jgi:RNA polymerase sigma-70 factor (ECF subfamily)